MGLRLVGAAALVAVCVASIGITPAHVAIGEAASPSAAERWAEDPATKQLAAEKGLSLPEAQRRIGVQQRATELGEVLGKTLGSARYGGVWIGDDDRIKVGTVQNGTRAAAHMAAVHKAAAAHRLAADTDVVPVRHSLASLLAANDWLSDQVVRTNKTARWPMLPGYTTAGNTVRLGLPPKSAGLSPGQRAVLGQAWHRYGALLSVYTLTERPKPEADCGWVSDGFTCDLPVRGGVLIGEYGCTLGFLARSRTDSRLYGLTAGHCLKDQAASTITFSRAKDDSRIPLGTRHNYVYGAAGDAGIINISDPKTREAAIACQCSWVTVLASPDNGGVPGTSANERYKILRDGTSTEGMRVCFTGKRSGTSCGRVLRLGVPSSTGVLNLTEANYCHTNGDSGGPVYAGNTAYGIHQGNGGTACTALYQGIRGAENVLNVDVLSDGASVQDIYWRAYKNELSTRKSSYVPGATSQPCHYRIRYGDYGTAAYAQVRLYTADQGCQQELQQGVGVEVFGEGGSGTWKKSSQVAGQQDSCGSYVEIQATSPAGHSAASMALVSSSGKRIFYSHHYTDLPFDNDGPLCP